MSFLFCVLATTSIDAVCSTPIYLTLCTIQLSSGSQDLPSVRYSRAHCIQITSYLHKATRRSCQFQSQPEALEEVDTACSGLAGKSCRLQCGKDQCTKATSRGPTGLARLVTRLMHQSAFMKNREAGSHLSKCLLICRFVFYSAFLRPAARDPSIAQYQAARNKALTFAA